MLPTLSQKEFFLIIVNYVTEFKGKNSHFKIGNELGSKI